MDFPSPASPTTALLPRSPLPENQVLVGHGFRLAAELPLGAACHKSGCFLKSNGVHAVSEAGGRRAIRKHMPEVRVAGVAQRFDPFQKRRSIEAIRDDVAR